MKFKRTLQRYGETPEPVTPYQKAAQIWDERIGSSRVQARNWRLMAFCCLTLSVGLAGGMVWQSAQSRVTPYVVEVDKLGEVRAVGPAIESYQPSDAQIARRLGAALVATHDFERAVACYETARRTREENAVAGPARRLRRREDQSLLNDSGTPDSERKAHRDVDETALDMQMELAELYDRLRRWDDAEAALERVADASGGGEKRHSDGDSTFLGGSSLSSSRRDVRACKLLCRVKAARGDQNGYGDALLRLKVAQEALVKTAETLGGEDKRALEAYKKALAETCAAAAGRFASFHDVERAHPQM